MIRDTPPPVMTRKDVLLLLTLIVTYSLIAFTRLGDTHAPQTVWAPQAGDYALLDMGEVTEIGSFWCMMGARHDKAFMLYASEDGQNWTYDHQVSEADVFAWTEIQMNIRARYVEIIPFGDGLMMQEAALRAADGTLLRITQTGAGAESLTDEQHLIPSSATYMNSTYFDEIYHARTGYEYANGIAVYENTHPPLGKDFIALSIKLFGMTPFAWRLPGVLFGILMIPLLYAFARALLNDNKWAFFSAFIFSFDFMHFAQTRLATIDTFVTFFIIAMYFCMYLYTSGISRHSFPQSLGWLCLCGVSSGLAVASKWPGLYAMAGLPVFFFPAWFVVWKQNKRQACGTLVACCLFFLVVPVVIYGLSYIPFVHASGGGGLQTILENQRTMFNYHTTLESEHRFSSRWWTWPLILRPMYIYANDVSPTLRQGISSFGNPAVWWAGIPATVYACVAAIRKRDYVPVFLIIAYAFQYLPWALVSRTTYIYHYFPSVSFIVLIIAYAGKDIGAHRIRWVYAYGTLVFTLFVLFYPVLSGLPFPTVIVRSLLRWLPGWVLM